jgi:hypothetical protein
MGFLGLFKSKKEREEEERAYYEEQERLAKEQARQSQGPPKELGIKTELFYKVHGPTYHVKLTNNSKDPMGQVEVTVVVDKALGIPLESTKSREMLDPDESTTFDFKIVPTLNLGAGTIKAMAGYFDFAKQDKVNFNLKVRSIQIACPQVQPTKVDDNTWRIKMSTLEKYEFESMEMEGNPPEIFEALCISAQKAGFFGIEPFVVPTLYRGLRKFIGSVNDDIYCIQVQVIGQEDLAKCLIECYAPTVQKAIGICARLLTPLDGQFHLKRSQKTDLPPGALDKALGTHAAKAQFNDSEVKVLGKDGRPLAEKGQPAQPKAERPPPAKTGAPGAKKEDEVEVWEEEHSAQMERTESSKPRSAPAKPAAPPQKPQTKTADAGDTKAETDGAKDTPPKPNDGKAVRKVRLTRG